jgi:hypothetical protein
MQTLPPTNLARDELIKVLNYDKKNSSQAKLPIKAGLVQEVIRWNPTNTNETRLKQMSRNEIIAQLYKGLNAKPRCRVTAKRYRRFGLSFDYKGATFPTPVYRQGMEGDEIKAMLELYPSPKLSVAQIKASLKD